ncbi:exonuclease domain-containing protein [Mycobacterium sp. AT1]|uniref:exonuclease domain-containing protein n=1 Tax=Mycobacterium sp. AT1 TaxID=1961706 RepID=UPI0009AD3E39|nr:exonuclease domain-containing protein [Mycobacterium sp. AT1]
MQGFGVLVAVLVVVGLLIKYWWVLAIIGAIGAAVYFFNKYSKDKTAAPPPSEQSAGRPVTQTQRPQTYFAAPQPRPPASSRDIGIRQAVLTRRTTGYPTSNAVFTAIDLETTGLDPDLDRIVEIGMVKFTADGTVIDEFATLVNNPGSPREARDVHQIDDADLIGAPQTIDALREAFAFMAGTVLVAHNFEFEEGFLTAAARREKLSLPATIGVCTLQTSRRQLDGRAFSLTVMYKTATGEFPTNKHTALGDARSIREILLWLLRSSPQPLNFSIAPPTAVATVAPCECKIRCRPVPLAGSSVAELLASFPQSSRNREGDPVEVEKYLALLAESVEDGLLTYEEASSLTDQACRTRLTGNQLRDLHREAWDTTFRDERDADWTVLSPVRRREMFLLADALGLSQLATELHQAIDACSEPEPASEARYLRSLRVAVVGDGADFELLCKRAESYGAKLAVNVTKTVVWMATETPDATDAKHNSARKLGVPMLPIEQASARLDAAIRDAELKAFERQRVIDENLARNRQYAAEREAYWRPTWRPVELDRDPDYAAGW